MTKSARWARACVVRALQPREIVTPTAMLSGADVVWGLMRAGFTIVDQPGGVVVLERGMRLVTVPTLPLLAREAMSVLLHAAGITYGELAALVAEAPTTPALAHVRGVREKHTGSG